MLPDIIGNSGVFRLTIASVIYPKMPGQLSIYWHIHIIKIISTHLIAQIVLCNKEKPYTFLALLFFSFLIPKTSYNSHNSQSINNRII